MNRCPDRASLCVILSIRNNQGPGLIIPGAENEAFAERVHFRIKKDDLQDA